MKVAIFCLFFLVFACFSVRSQLYGPNRAQTISNIFQIPIQTLTAISNVAQSTRPLGEVVQRRRRPIQQNPQLRPVYPGGISRAARVAGLSPAGDGSFFRI